MHSHEFWRIVDECVAQAPSDRDPEKPSSIDSYRVIDERVAVLKRSLARRAPGEIRGWFEALEIVLAIAATPESHAAAQLAGFDDDGFLDLRGWFILQGKHRYDWWLANIDQLAEAGDPSNWRVSKILYVAQDAYELATGKEAPFIFPDDLYRNHPEFAPIAPAAMAAALPKLAARFRGEEV